VSVTPDGWTTEVPMPSLEESILDATLRVRPDAPFSCTNVDAGVVLACQAHPVTTTITLDDDA
jgi:ring-1,2-phenylacetyl-CoA epoxidase subunit PaaE